jgi:hypothetical protein
MHGKRLLTAVVLGATVIWCASLSSADNAQDFRFSRSSNCAATAQDPSSSKDRIIVTRTASTVRVKIHSAVTCGAEASEPTITFEAGRVVLSVKEKAGPSGALAACLCSEVVNFEILRPLSRGTQILFTRPGREALSGTVP